MFLSVVCLYSSRRVTANKTKLKNNNVPRVKATSNKPAQATIFIEHCLRGKKNHSLFSALKTSLAIIPYQNKNLPFMCDKRCSQTKFKHVQFLNR